MHILQIKLYRSSFHKNVLNNDDGVRRWKGDGGRCHFTWFLNKGDVGRRVGGTSNVVWFYWMMMVVEEVEEMVIEAISDFIEW